MKAIRRSRLPDESFGDRGETVTDSSGGERTGAIRYRGQLYGLETGGDSPAGAVRPAPVERAQVIVDFKTGSADQTEYWRQVEVHAKAPSASVSPRNIV